MSNETPEQARARFWLYFDEEHPDEGGVFPFVSREEALAHARDADPDAPWVILEREATDDEAPFIEFGAARERASYQPLVDAARSLVESEARGVNHGCGCGVCNPCSLRMALITLDEAGTHTSGEGE